MQTHCTIPVHDTQHLFSDILSPLQRSDLYKVLIAPWIGKFVVLPRVVDCQKSEMVALSLVKLCLLLISQLLFVLLINELMIGQAILHPKGGCTS